jgi:ABC-type transporter Mla maintaining outer membrane lipid asymmetry permease subunit MlaE
MKFTILEFVGRKTGYAVNHFLNHLAFGDSAAAWTISSPSISEFLTQVGKAIMLTDIAVGCVKAFCFGVIISITCMYHGLGLASQNVKIPIMASQAAVY